MAKGKAEPPEHEILRAAALLSEGDEGLGWDELGRALESAGIDPARTAARFHESARQLAEDVRRAGRTVPLSLQEAIAASELTAVPTQRESPEPETAHVFAEHWLNRFLVPFALPTHLEASRAYRKVGNLAEKDQRDLDM